MKKSILIVLVLFLATLGRASASGPLGVYGVIERVVFEPSESAPERVQVWGAFAYVDGATNAGAVSKASRGYLYFRLPDLVGAKDATYIANVKREWADLKSVAGTGQAVGFGRWGYIAGFGSLQPDQRPNPPSVILHDVPRGGATSDLRVRPASEAPAAPAVYQTNIGVVKLSERGSHAAVVKQLKDALGQR